MTCILRLINERNIELCKIAKLKESLYSYKNYALNEIDGIYLEEENTLIEIIKEFEDTHEGEDLRKLAEVEIENDDDIYLSLVELKNEFSSLEEILAEAQNLYNEYFPSKD